MRDFLIEDKLKIKDIVPGRYVLAVSGGVDSMVLLDLLSKNSELDLIVAHFNHGIRKDAAVDEKLVREVAHDFELKYEVGYGQLGENTSEEKAREARYVFLGSIKQKYDADAIITAHHRDDVIETAIINIMRGSGRKGMTSIISNKNVIRPLVGVNKADLVNHAVLNGVNWREDYTNSELKYTRNYLRRRIDVSKNKRESHKLAKNIESIAKINLELDDKIATLSQKIMKDSQIDRSLFTLLPPIIAKELLVYWLRDLDRSSFDKRTVERLYIKLKTAPHNSKHDINNKWKLVTERDKAFFSNNRVGSLI